MLPDTRRGRQNDDVPTDIRSVRVDDGLWLAAKGVAKVEGESVSDVVRRALVAYTANPSAFNLAVAKVRAEA